jgi:hypothetical protein
MKKSSLIQKAVLAIAVVIFALSVHTAFSQSWPWQKQAEESEVVKQTLNLDEFHSIGLGLSADVRLSPGNKQEVVVEGPKYLIENLNRDVRNGFWNIEFTTKMRYSKRLTIYITMEELKAISLGGSGKIYTTAPFQNLGELSFSIGGSGEITFSGSAESLKVSIGGSGKVNAKDLRVRSSKVSIAGSGDCYIDVADNLEVAVAGSGSVLYKGRPKIKSSIAGSGKVETIMD